VTPRGRLATVASALLLAYLLVWMAELTSLRFSESAFDRLQEWSASLPGRLVACSVWLAAVYHLLEGGRAAFHPGELVPVGRDDGGRVAPTTRRDDTFGAGLIAFVTWTLVLPGWVVLLRPWIEDVVG
jgi:hypothetical protein